MNCATSAIVHVWNPSVAYLTRRTSRAGLVVMWPASTDQPKHGGEILAPVIAGTGQTLFQITQALDLGRRNKGQRTVSHEIGGAVPNSLAQALLDHRASR